MRSVLPNSIQNGSASMMAKPPRPPRLPFCRLCWLVAHDTFSKRDTSAPSRRRAISRSAALRRPPIPLMAKAPTSEARLERDWATYTKGLLRAEMARRQVTYQGLTDKLAEIGVKDTEANVRNKIARGAFTAVFFLQCLHALGTKSIRLNDD